MASKKKPKVIHQDLVKARDDSLKEVVADFHRRELDGKTPGQKRYLRAIRSSTITIGTGPAGAGKTYIACGVAAQLFRTGQVDKIIITRPVVPCDEEIGFMPGELMEKVGEEMKPMLEALEDFFSHQELDSLLRSENIIIAPLGKIRGRTFKRAFVLLDEAQNATYRQLRMFLTRLGENSRMVVNGDHTQSDIPGDGLIRVVRAFEEDCHKSISIVRLGREDIVRHELIQWIDERLTGAPSKQEDDTEDEPAPSYTSSFLKL